MAQSLDLRVSILDAKAKVELKEIDGKIQQIQKRAEKGINLVSSVETRDVEGKLKGVVNTYKDAADKIEVYSQKINKAGKVSFSVSEKSGVNWAEKQAQAYGKAIAKQEELERSFTKITASVSSFASLSDTAFAQYSKGVMSATEATEQSARAAQYSSQTWQQYYNVLNGVGQSCGITAKEVSVFGELSDDAFHKYSTGAMSADAANKSLESSSSEVSKEQKNVASATEEAGNKAEKSGKAFTLLHSVFLRLAHTAISAVTRSFREALTEMKNVDSELVVVRKVSDATAEELSALKDRAYEVGAAYGVAASDYLRAAAEMTRAGYREQAGDLAELATKLQLVGDVSQDVANQFLIATDKSYKMNGNYEKLSETIDKLNEIDNNFATSFEKVADGIGLLAPVAAQANVSFDEMAAAIGTVTAVTQRSGTESARALRSLFLNIIKDTNTEIEDGVTWSVEEINNLSDALKKYAPDVVKAAEATGELINPMEAVGALAKSYKEGLLTNQDLFDIVSGLGGKLRTSQLLALIQNWDMYNQMLEKTADAAGSADKEVSNALDSWEVKLNQLKNTFTQFAQSILDSEEIKGFIDAIRYLIESIDNPEATEKFQQAFENFVNSLVQKLPRIQEVINQVAITLTKTILSTLAKEAPQILDYLYSGAIKVTHELSKQLPNIIGNFVKLVFEIITKSIVDQDLAYKLVSDLFVGIVSAIPHAIIGVVEGIGDALSQSFRGKDGKKIIDKILSNFPTYSLGKAIGKSIGLIEDDDEPESKAKYSEEENLQEIDNIKELTKQYNELRESFKAGKTTREEYESAQDAIIGKLKDEGIWTDAAKDGYDNLTDAINKSSEAAINARKVDLFHGLSDAKKAFQDFWSGAGNDTYALLTDITTRDFIDGYDLGQSFHKNAEGNLVMFTKDFANYDRSLSELLTYYKRLLTIRQDLYDAGKTETKEYSHIDRLIGTLEPEVDKLRISADAYLSVLDEAEREAFFDESDFGRWLVNDYENRQQAEAIAEAYTSALIEASDAELDESSSVGKLKISFDGLSKSVKTASEHIESYKKLLEDSGEKGDVFKSYAEAYKSAMEMYEKGATGSNAYMAAVDLLIPPEIMRELHYDYEEAGKVLGSDFVKAMFSEGGDDYGANAANYIRKHLDEFRGVEIIEGENGKFGFNITDMYEFSQSTGIATDALYALIDALDIFDSQSTIVNSDIDYLLENFSDLISIDASSGKKTLNITKLIQELISSGYSTVQIYQIIDAFKELANADDSFEVIEPKNLEETIKSLQELNEEASEDDNIDVVLTSNGEEFFGELKKEIENLDGTVINIYFKSHSIDEVQTNASGTSSARGGLSLVNEEGAEIIYANNKAWIAGGGDPTITNLPVGARVFNAKQTREILTRSGINSFANVVNIPLTDGGEGGGNGGKSKTKSLDKLLEEINEYIEDILEKAREALQEQLDAIDEQIEKLKREHDAEADANKLEELRLKILEAEQRLAEAQNERTVRYFNKETGQWEWMADQKAVADAQKALQDARDAYDKEVAEQAYDAQIQALEDQKDALEDAYDELEDKWDDILSELESIVNGNTTTDIGKLLSQLLKTKGGGYASGIENLIAEIGKYTESPISSLDAETTARILSLQGVGGSQNILSALLGNGAYDLNGNGTPTSGATTNIAGDTVYYINGVKIGSDMMDKPLSQILSVLPIYAS